MQFLSTEKPVTVQNLTSNEAFLSLDGIFRNAVDLHEAIPEDLLSDVFSNDRDLNPAKHTVYNFEVEDTHTYIAGGYRVHNRSTLSYWDPEQNGEIQSISTDSNGNIVVVTNSDDGGTWTITAIAENGSGSTTRVEKEYSYTSEQGTFYLNQTETYSDDGNGGENLTNVELGDYRLVGGVTGAPVAAALTPFLLQAFDLDSPLEQLVGGTLIQAVLQNLLEVGGDIIHHSLLDATTNGDAIQQISENALSDFGTELGQIGVDNAVSMVSQLITAEIFGEAELGGVGGAIMSAFVSQGVNVFLSQGVGYLLDSTGLFPEYTPQTFGNPLSLLVTTVLKEILPDLETVEGAAASAVVSALVKHLFAEALGAAGFLGPAVVPLLIGYVVGKIFDALFGKDPEAFADIGFNAASGEFSILGLRSDDGGDIKIAEALGESVSNYMLQFTSALASNSNNFDAVNIKTIGYKEDDFIDSNGKHYGWGDMNAVFTTVVELVKQLRVNDGDLKVARALDFDNLEAAIADMTDKEAFSYIYTLMRVAVDYQYYLENAEAINLLMTTSPESAEAMAWIATLLKAAELGLSDGFVADGDAIDNNFVTADGHDSISGHGGDDIIRSFGGMDTISGGVGDDTLLAGAGDDVLYGDEGDDVLDTGIGNNTVHAGEGNDTVFAFDGSDLIYGGDGYNEIGAGAGNNTVFGGEDRDTITSGFGDDSIDAGSDDDIVRSGAGIDIIYGQSGDDWLDAGDDADQIYGGSGNDWAAFLSASDGVIANLTTGVGTLGSALGDTYYSIENLDGSNHSDELAGDELTNILHGNAGNDLIWAGLGSDSVRGGDGDDTIFGDWDLTSLDGGNDTLVGGDGDDLMFGSAGKDEFHGGDGFDIISYRLSTRGVIADIDLGFTRVYGYLEEFTGIDGLVGSVYADILVGDDGSNLFRGLDGDDHLRGGEGADIYEYAFGNGNDHISDLDNDAGVIDRLVLSDVAPDEVSFSSLSSEDLVITLSNGERITVADHFAESGDAAIEEIQFAGGIVLNAEAIRNKSVADQKANGSGSVIGSDLAESYTHALGDGTYTISDWDNNERTDRLVFSDVNANDVSFTSTSGEDLTITLSNGERVTIWDHFAESGDAAIEEIQFADGTILDAEAIRNKSIEDQKSNGTDLVRGSDHAETYTHALGDGSYRISDWDNNNRTDKLVFSGVNSDQVVFNQKGTDLRIIVMATEVITVLGQLDGSGNNLIESFEFADGVIWSNIDVVANIVASASAPNDQVGTEDSEAYTHTLGDGSYVITDYDYLANSGTDTLAFADVNVDDVVLSRSGTDLIFTLSTGEQVTVTKQLDDDRYHSIESVSFADGTTLDQSALRDRLMDDMKALGEVIGTANSEAYTHALGDGSYTIKDYDYLANSGTDTLTFTDVNADDVIVYRSGNNLVFRLSNGEEVTILNQLDSDRYHSIENVGFADGITFTQIELRDRLVSDMKDGGAVIGTENVEAYSHTLGDGSYSISDYDYLANNGLDRLTFTDVNQGDVTFSRSGNDLILTLTNGEQVTLVRQLDADQYRTIETIAFADGSFLNEMEIRDRLVFDMKDGGTVIGTENVEAYSHTLGDGSYSISDYDYLGNNGTDSLTFTNVNQDEITFGRSGTNLILTLSNGEQITVIRQLDVDHYRSVETIGFADGSSLNEMDIRNRLVADMKAGGTVVGSELAEAYSHTLGDGSYTILDYDYLGNSGIDVLTFTNVNLDEVSFSHDGNGNMLIALTNGETILLQGHFAADKYNSIERIQFADGVLLDLQAIRDKSVSDMKSSGSVIGTELKENYSHALGDGSYTIEDYDYLSNGGSDHLTFSDANAEDVKFSRTEDNDLVLTHLNGDEVTIKNQFGTGFHRLEAIVFADGTEYQQTGILLKTSHDTIDSQSSDGDDVIIGDT
jgi:Ca2+-binding RTX toxin-like protein